MLFFKPIHIPCWNLRIHSVCGIMQSAEAMDAFMTSSFPCITALVMMKCCPATGLLHGLAFSVCQAPLQAGSTQCRGRANRFLQELPKPACGKQPHVSFQITPKPTKIWCLTMVRRKERATLLGLFSNEEGITNGIFKILRVLSFCLGTYVLMGVYYSDFIKQASLEDVQARLVHCSPGGSQSKLKYRNFLQTELHLICVFSQGNWEICDSPPPP